ncbi:MAG: SCO family protein, partial [Armatimonadota bacterium]|nr:SCO family protein [Armatimonadota bacterium]
DQRLNEQVPLDLRFKDEAGKSVRLGDYFGKKPALLMPLYYRCSMLCPEEMNILIDSLKELKFTIGKEFDVIVLSIDPHEIPADAANAEQEWVQRYGRGTTAGWHLLTGEEPAIRQLTQAIGFRYVYDATQKEYAHPDGFVILTPHGKVARYFYRFEYPARDLRFGLIEASANKIGSPLDYIWLQCYHYNPVTGQYSFAVMGVLRLFCAGLVVFGLLWIVASLLREKRAQLKVEPGMMETKV